MPTAAAPPPECLQLLREVFAHAEFRGRQGEVIAQLMAGGDALALMPTGGGKSLCYQLPAVAHWRAGRGVTLVISPLIALMHDQVGALQQLDVPAAFLNSTLAPREAHEVEQQLLRGQLALLYVAPERVTTPRFVQMLDTLAARGQLALFAIDEAHCVSQWGHDFRPEYRALTLLHERWPHVPRVALTATADAITREDIAARLHLGAAPAFISSFDRPNIRYSIVERRQPMPQLLQFLRAHRGEAGIVYAATRARVEEIAAKLAAAGVRALPYHAGLSTEMRQRHQEAFLHEAGCVICATIAFGMGIDKPDVRFVAHFDLPKNIESYYQETGRAGRDGEPAEAWMAYGLSDVVLQRRLIDEGDASEEFKRVQRAKLDALLALAEAGDCRRARLLAYFGETPAHDNCGNCDNCLNPPQLLDASDCARRLLSCIWRVQHMSGAAFGAQHIIDVLHGRRTDKVLRHGHERLSTFGIGAQFSTAHLRGVLRQLLALGALRVAGEHGGLQLQSAARPILRGAQSVLLRQAARQPRGIRARSAAAAAAPALAPAQHARFEALRAWRLAAARAASVPAYCILPDSVLRCIAQNAPRTLEQLRTISGIGTAKLRRYGQALLDATAALP